LPQATRGPAALRGGGYASLWNVRTRDDGRPQFPGPGRLENVEGVHWTDIVGYRRASGNTFRGVANTVNWFHLPVPSLGLVDHVATGLGEIYVQFLATATARVQSIRVSTGHIELFTRDNLNLSGSFAAAYARFVI
jgi:hypothetical protein